jgi:phage terminase small subunit
VSELTAKQRLFVYHYIATNMNGTKAARLAGYQGDENTLAVTAYENLRKPKIRAAISEFLEEQAMGAAEVIARLSAMARGSIEDVLEVALVDGKPTVTGAVDLQAAYDARKLGLVKKATITEREFAGITTRTIKVEMHDAKAALDTLARYHGLLLDRLKVEDWRSEAIDLIRRGAVKYEPLVEELGEDLATELFKSAGVPIA